MRETKVRKDEKERTIHMSLSKDKDFLSNT
jgi:hypothetical protein